LKNYKQLEQLVSVNTTLTLVKTLKAPPDIASQLMFQWMLKYLEELRDTLGDKE